MARQAILSVETRGPGLYEFTDRAAAFVKASGETSGLLTLFVLFFFTEAYLWAVQYTSINRMFLHFTPVLLFWVLTVSVRPPGKTRCLNSVSNPMPSAR